MKIKKIGKLIFLVVLLNISFAQEAQININKKGLGENPQEMYFTIHNTGEIDITNVKISIDGKKVKTIQSKTSPNKGFEVSFLLKPGEHLIEAETPEGAYDSLKVTISPVRKKDSAKSEKDLVKSFTETIDFKALLIFGIVSLVIVWLIMKKPKLD